MNQSPAGEPFVVSSDRRLYRSVRTFSFWWDFCDRSRDGPGASSLHAGCISALRGLHTGCRPHHRLPQKQRTAAEQALLRRILPRPGSERMIRSGSPSIVLRVLFSSSTGYVDMTRDGCAAKSAMPRFLSHACRDKLERARFTARLSTLKPPFLFARWFRTPSIILLLK